MTPDSYTMRARLAPASLLVAPPLLVLGCLGYTVNSLALYGGGALFAVVLIASGQIAIRGREVQAALFESWDGSPTVQRLRWSSADTDAVTRRHAAMRAAGAPALPSADDEQGDPKWADREYDQAIVGVRGRFREADGHRILADTNAEYGLRRNCFAVRGLGRLTAGASASVAFVLWAMSAGDRPASFLVAALISSVVFLIWEQILTEAGARAAAERYADQFFETAQSYLIVQHGTSNRLHGIPTEERR